MLRETLNAFFLVLPEQVAGNRHFFVCRVVPDLDIPVISSTVRLAIKSEVAEVVNDSVDYGLVDDINRCISCRDAFIIGGPSAPGSNSRTVRGPHSQLQFVVYAGNETPKKPTLMKELLF